MQSQPELSVALRVPPSIGYRDVFLSTPILATVRNRTSRAVRFTLSLEGEGSLVPCTRQATAEADGSVTLSFVALSPVSLAARKEPARERIRALLTVGGKAAGEDEATTTVLPFDWWEGLGESAALLACQIRPGTERAADLMRAAEERRRRWQSAEGPRFALAALFEEIRSRRLVRRPSPDLTRPLPTGGEDAFCVALLACAALERAGLRPVLALGKGVGVGVWLYDSCFLEAAYTDAETVAQYLRAGNLAFFDAEDLLPSRGRGFSLSEAHFAERIYGFSCFLDVRRCRLGGIAPCPVRAETEKGYEIRRTEEYDGSAPRPLPSASAVPVLPALPAPPPQGREMWERRLFDLTARNPLVSFSGKGALRIAAADLAALSRFCGELRLFGGGEEGEEGASLRELYALEERNGYLRAVARPAAAEKVCESLYRRAREAEEEGAQVLCLALGMLTYPCGGELRRAPLSLLPVRMVRRGGNYFLARAGEAAGNNTLFEVLRREHGVGIAGEGDLVRRHALVAAAVAGRHGFRIDDEVFLGTFSFQRYFLWKDLRGNFGAFLKNDVVRALVEGVPLSFRSGEGQREALLLPLPADGAQYRALERAAAGESFVLHGPPGTGKSQTIANMIANALYRGKRVLFVAEKKAALDVVKARLDKIGAGEFCLELSGGGREKREVIRGMARTLALEAGEEAGARPETEAPRAALAGALDALHRKRRAGFSVYEAIAGYLDRRDAPDLLGVDGAFCEKLTEARLALFRREVLAAAAAAKECGGVYRTPFAGVRLDRWDRAVEDRLRCACEAVVAEGEHLRRMVLLVCEKFAQRPIPLTRASLSALCDVAREVAEGRCVPYAEGDAGEFLSLNRALDLRLTEMRARFGREIRIPRSEELLRYLDGGGDWKLSPAALAAVERMRRKSASPLFDEEAPRALRVALEAKNLLRRIAGNRSAARLFCRGKRVLRRRRARILAPFYALCGRAEAIFPDFRPDGFFAACARPEALSPLIGGLLRATESFSAAEAELCAAARMRQDGEIGERIGRAAALLENLDLLPALCAYRAASERLAGEGLPFLTDALEDGTLDVDNVLLSFEKGVYRAFLEREIPADPLLSRMTVGSLDETAEALRTAAKDYALYSRRALRAALLSHRGEGAADLPAFRRFEANELRGTVLCDFFAKIPALFGALCPCLLMSPGAVAETLPAAASFDLVIFDEASQLPTAEAIGALARGRAAVVVGDPKQLPPTPFFNAPAEEEGGLLEDCLAAGLPEEKLLWHYRSRHESLIAFSNETYYGGKLLTFPSPDARRSRVTLVPVEGTYDRARTKRNAAEAEALVREVVRRLLDRGLAAKSMGVVTFAGAQRDDIERRLTREIARRGLEKAAYEREEPLFVKNLENVQGDERDVILFSVGYGRDAAGRLSHNFGPLNQSGGWRRLNVAVSRAREEMLVFSSLSSSEIDLSRTEARGVRDLKAFLAFAEEGKGTLRPPAETGGAARRLAEGLKKCGYSCDLGVGASGFSVDVAVVDPRDESRYLLAVLGDGGKFSVDDRYVLQPGALAARGWGVAQMGSVGFFNNPGREIMRIKALCDRLLGRPQEDALKRYSRAYRFLKRFSAETPAFFEGGENDGAIKARLKEIVAAEEPICRSFLKQRCLDTYGTEGSPRIGQKLDKLIDECGFLRDRALGVDYFYRTPQAVSPTRFRVEEGTPRRRAEDLTVYEMVALVKGALEEKVALYMDELVPYAAVALHLQPSERFGRYLGECVAYGEEKGIFARSPSGRVSLA